MAADAPSRTTSPISPALVRDARPAALLRDLFAPAALRADLFALYGFAAEIARIPDQVSEPTLGEIRLQWWRDALQAAAERGGATARRSARLRDAIARHRAAARAASTR